MEEGSYDHDETDFEEVVQSFPPMDHHLMNVEG